MSWNLSYFTSYLLCYDTSLWKKCRLFTFAWRSVMDCLKQDLMFKLKLVAAWMGENTFFFYKTVGPTCHGVHPIPQYKYNTDRLKIWSLPREWQGPEVHPLWKKQLTKFKFICPINFKISCVQFESLMLAAKKGWR